MSIRVVCCWFATFFLVLLNSQPAVASLEQRIPDDAVVALHWRGTDHIKKTYPDSHTVAVYQASGLNVLLNERLPDLLQTIAARNPRFGRQPEVIRNVLLALVRHPTLLYIGPSAPEVAQPLPTVAVICDAGGDAEMLHQQLLSLFRPTNPVAMMIGVRRFDEVVALQFGMMPPESMARLGLLPRAEIEPAKALVDSPEYRSAVKHVHDDAVLSLYVNLQALFTLIERNQTWPQKKKNWREFQQFMGLDGIKQLLVTQTIEDRNWVTRAFLDAPAPRGRLMQWLQFAPLDETVLSRIPATATSFSAVRFDPYHMFTQFRRDAGEDEPRIEAEIAEGFAKFQREYGIDLEREVLEPLGDHWIMYSDPTTFGKGMTGRVLIHPLDDADAFAAGYDKLRKRGNQKLAQSAAHMPVGFQLRRIPREDGDIDYVPILVFTPSWSLRDGSVYFALAPQTVASAVEPAAAGDSFAAHQELARWRENFGGVQPWAIGFSDLRQSVTSSYSLLLILSQGSSGLTELLTAGDDGMMLLPPLPVLRQHVSPMYHMAWMDDAGLHAAMQSPFPGAALLNVSDSISSVQSVAILTGILLPSMGSARRAANKARTINTVQIFMQAIGGFVKEHGRMPNSLGELYVKDFVRNPAMYLPAENPLAMPEGFPEWPVERAAAWMEANAAFVYVGKDLPAEDKNHVWVVIYQKPEYRYDDDVIVGFSDGRAMPVSNETLQTLLLQQGR